VNEATEKLVKAMNSTDFEVFACFLTDPPTIKILAYNPNAGPRGQQGQSSRGKKKRVDRWLGTGPEALEKAFQFLE